MPFLFSLPVDIVRLPGKVPLLPEGQTVIYGIWLESDKRVTQTPFD